MPRRFTAKMQTRVRCGVETVVERQRFNPETREYDSYSVHGVCGESRKAHGETVSIKRKGEQAGIKQILPPKVTGHEYGDEYSFKVKCRACQEDIEPGTQYAFWLSKNRGKVVQHATCPSPPRSFWTNSEILSNAWAISDQTPPEFTTLDELEEWATEVGDQIRSDLVELIEEKMQNILDGIGHEVPVYYELEERKDAFEQWADQADDINSYVSDDEPSCAACQRTEEEHEEDDEECDEFDPDFGFLQDAAHELLGECPE